MKTTDFVKFKDILGLNNLKISFRFNPKEIAAIYCDKRKKQWILEYNNNTIDFLIIHELGHLLIFINFKGLFSRQHFLGLPVMSNSTKSGNFI